MAGNLSNVVKNSMQIKVGGSLIVISTVEIECEDLFLSRQGEVSNAIT